MKIGKQHILKISIIILAILLIALIAVFVIKKTFTHDDMVTKKVEKCTITQIVEASGTINPVNTVSVGSVISGLVKAIYVDYNSEVKQGQILAQIDTANYEATLLQNQAAIASAEANLAKLNAQAELSEITYKRYKRLYAKNFVAKSELDTAESEHKAMLAQIRAAKAQIKQAKAQLKTTQNNIGYSQIKAPVNGTVISRKVDVGQSVAASFQAPELFKIAQDLTEMQIEVNVSEADIGKVKEGQAVTYTLDGYPDEQFHGTVSQVRLSSTTVSNVVTYSVIVNVENEELKLKPGMTANVSIITDQKSDVLCAPNSALKVSFGAGKKYEKQGVWIIDKYHQPQRVNIEVGASDDSVFEIISNKIQVGDTIVIQHFNGNKSPNAKKDRPPMM